MLRRIVRLSALMDALGGGVPATNDELRLPSRPPEVRGLLARDTAAPSEGSGGRRWLVMRPEPESRERRLHVLTVPPTARVVQRVGHEAHPTLLTVCQDLRVWLVSGAVAPRDDRPATAEAIVIERILEHRVRK